MDVVNQEQRKNVATGEAQRAPAPRREERAQVLAPPVDIFEGKDAFLVLVDLPGVAHEGLAVRLEKGELIVEGKRSDESGRLPGAVYRRVFAIPPELDGDSARATLSRGVLQLEIPRKASAKPREIPVKSA